MGKNFSRTCIQAKVAKNLVTEAAFILQTLYEMGEFNPGSKLDKRAYAIYQDAWQIREKLIDLVAVLNAESGKLDEAYTEEFIQSERYELGLMSEDEEKEYVWKEQQKEPF